MTGASKGIGAAVARAFVAEGARVWLADIDEPPGRALADELGDAATFVHLDVTDGDAWARAVASLEEQEGRLHLLVNNAGGGVLGDIESTDLDSWRFVQRLNVESVVLGIQRCLPLLKKQGDRGAIINLSSVAGLLGDPNMPAYCAAKGAVRLLTKSVALHCARRGYGTRVNSVHPSFIDTPLVRTLIDVGGPGAEERLTKAAPLRRLGRPEEVAGMVVYLASDEGRFVTGAELVIDGGMTAR